jgi:ribosomal RNA-processing protein 12
MTFGSEDGGIVSELQSRHGHSAQPESQQVLAVLGAVLEVISSQGMPATPTSMFAAIMSAMETTDAQQSPVVSPSSQQ